MAELSLQTEACVIARATPAEKTIAYQVLSFEHGVLTLHQRRAGTSSQSVIDLFDELWVSLASDNQGRSWFLREHRVLRRRQGLGRGYETLRAASRIGALIAANPGTGQEAAAPLTRLASRALDALEEGAEPACVYLKFLYTFARDEGHPVRAQWAGGLHPALRERALQLLGSPLSDLSPSPDLRRETEELIGKLETFLRGHTELQIRS